MISYNKNRLRPLTNLKNKPLRIWNKKTFGEINYNISKFEAEIEQLEKKNEVEEIDETEWARHIALKGQLARENSIKFKDRSTKYYHAVAMGKRRRNKILALNMGVKRIKGPKAIKNATKRFF